MQGQFLMWVYKLISLYLSLWTQGPREPNRRSSVRITMSSQTNYTTQAHRCLETFHSLRERLEPAFYHDGSPTLYLHLYKEAYCMQYKLLLQCLHELLSRHKNPDLLTLVQDRLIEPWALRTNQLCDINVKNTAQVANSFTPWKPNDVSTNSKSEKLPDRNHQRHSESTNGNSNFTPKSEHNLLYMPRKDPKLMLDSDNQNKLQILFEIFKTKTKGPQPNRTTEADLVVHNNEITKVGNTIHLENKDQSQMNKMNTTSIQDHETIRFQPSE